MGKKKKPIGLGMKGGDKEGLVYISEKKEIMLMGSLS